jgi:hypothetical protein
MKHQKKATSVRASKYDFSIVFTFPVFTMSKHQNNRDTSLNYFIKGCLKHADKLNKNHTQLSEFPCVASAMS